MVTVSNECKLQRDVTQPVLGVAVGLCKIRQARIDRLVGLFACIVVVNLRCRLPLDCSEDCVMFWGLQERLNSDWVIAEYTSADCCIVYVIYLLVVIFAYIIIFVTPVCKLCFGIGKCMLTTPHKSSMVRRPVAQKIDGCKGYLCELSVLHLVLAPLFRGVCDPVALT